MYFNAVHPSEDVDLTAAPATLGIARRTIAEVNELTSWSPTNGLCLAWPPASRVVTASGTPQLLERFETAVNLTMMPNFVPFIWNRPGSGSGCTTEQAGATKAINDLLASVHGHAENSSIRLFPGGWLSGERVSFQTLRLRGAFLLSASAEGVAGGGPPHLLSCEVTSLTGMLLRLHWPRPKPPLVTLSGSGSGSAVAIAHDLARRTYSWNTTAGATYKISEASTT